MSRKTPPGKLESEIIELVRMKGSITFFEFMDLALYHPTLGFYASPRRGPGTDYRTSPTLTNAFGNLLGRALSSMRNSLEADFLNVVEVGAGTGNLASSVLESHPDMRWTFVERSPLLIEAQRRAVWGGRGCSWVNELGEVPPFVGCLLANEVLDNFPVHVFEKRNRPLEVFVSIQGDRLVEELKEPSTEELRRWSERLADPLEEGDRFEVRPGVASFAEKASEALLRGYVLIIDYGDTAPALQMSHRSGTVVTYRADLLGADPLSSPGEVDITAHVDFSDLRNELERRGFDHIQLINQADFMESLGIRELEESVEKQRRAAETEGRHSDFVSLTAERGRLHALRARGGMGEFKVLIASRNAPAFRGFS